jgi:hypothetical protein
MFWSLYHFRVCPTSDYFRPSPLTMLAAISVYPLKSCLLGCQNTAYNGEAADDELDDEARILSGQRKNISYFGLQI